MVWDEETIKEEFEQESEEKLPVLKEVIKNEIRGESQSNNILIEGDNYHALSVLNYTHKGMIDVIYIDPPYNTGSNSWKYNNKFIQEDEPFKHSKWISFITKRLRLTKKLLKKNGIICITIDNHEVHNLRHIMEDVFSDRDIIITVIQHNFRGRAKNNFALTHEYALWAVPKYIESITRLAEKSSDIRRNLRRTGQGSKRIDSPTMFFGIEVNQDTLEILSVSDPIYEKKLPITNNNDTKYIFPIDNERVERRWYYSPKTVLSELKKKNIYAKKIRNKIEIHYWKSGKEKRRKSVWTDSKYDGSTFGSELLTEIIGENDFPFPKSIHAVKECIMAMTNKKDAVILDFFAGSGTTGHAVLELNNEDNGNRKFILCTNNEGDICTSVCHPRLKNVIKGYKFKGNQKNLLFGEPLTLTKFKKCEQILNEIDQIKLEQKKEFNNFKTELKNDMIKLFGIKNIVKKKEGLGSNLKYFKTDFVDWQYTTKQNKKNLVDRSVEMLCLREDCFELVKEKSHFKIFKNSSHHMAIISNYDGIDEFNNLIKKMNEKSKFKKKINLYVFPPFDDGVDEGDFAEIKKHVNLIPIPSSILNVYRKLFRSV